MAAPNHTPIPRPAWRCDAHEGLATTLARLEERTVRILELVEQQRQRDDELDRRQREDGGRSQRLSGAWGGALRAVGLMVALGAGIGGMIAAIAAVAKIIGG